MLLPFVVYTNEVEQPTKLDVFSSHFFSSPSDFQQVCSYNINDDTGEAMLKEQQVTRYGVLA